MEIFNEYDSLGFSTKLAIGSFSIGTLLFILYFVLTNNDEIVILGISFLIFAVFFNSAVFLNLIFQLLTNPEERENTVIKILIVLANIPIAFLYFLIITKSIKSTF